MQVYKGKRYTWEQLADLLGETTHSLRYKKSIGVPLDKKTRQHLRRGVVVGATYGLLQLIEANVHKKRESWYHLFRCTRCGAEQTTTIYHAESYHGKGCRHCSKSVVIDLFGERMSLSSAVQYASLPTNTVKHRLEKGYTLPQALGLHPPPRKEK